VCATGGGVDPLPIYLDAVIPLAATAAALVLEGGIFLCKILSADGASLSLALAHGLGATLVFSASCAGG
jgi:hypothetical protein